MALFPRYEARFMECMILRETGNFGLVVGSVRTAQTLKGTSRYMLSYLADLSSSGGDLSWWWWWWWYEFVIVIEFAV